jgi:energy-coupling factor transport system substrate-specific component
VRRTLLEALALLLVPAGLATCAALGLEQSALVLTLLAALSLLPFFVGLERDRLRPRDLMPIVVFATLAVVGRIILAPFPSIKPVSAIVIMAGVSFGRRHGFMVGALAALASNFLFGQGPWTPWQMYGWGLMGYLAGVLERAGAFKHPAAVFVYGFVAAFGFSLLLDSYYFVGFVSEKNTASLIAAYGSGFAFSLPHALATVAFLAPIYLPWRKKLDRLKRKYGINQGSAE